MSGRRCARCWRTASGSSGTELAYCNQPKRSLPRVVQIWPLPPGTRWRVVVLRLGDPIAPSPMCDTSLPQPGHHVLEFRNVRSRAQFQACTNVVRRTEALWGLAAGSHQLGEYRGIAGQ